MMLAILNPRFFCLAIAAGLLASSMIPGTAVAADPAPRVILRGTVVGSKNQPLANARLFLSVDEWTDPIDLGVTADDGTYRFEIAQARVKRLYLPSINHADQRVALIAIAPGSTEGAGYAILPSSTDERMGDMRSEYINNFSLQLDQAISGRVLDQNGRPIASASVRVTRIYDLADKRWHKFPEAILTKNPDFMTRPEADATNWFTPLYQTAWHALPLATTDADGRFTLRGAGKNRVVVLAVTGPGVRTTDAIVITHDDPDTAEFARRMRSKYPGVQDHAGYFYPPRKDSPTSLALRIYDPSPAIQVDPARTVSGTVRDASTGAPVAGVRVGVADAFGVGRATTDRRGKYRLMRAENASTIQLYTAIDEPNPYLKTVVELHDASALGEIVADVNLTRGIRIDGHVFESGTEKPILAKPSSGCHVVYPGPLLAGNIWYYPLATNSVIRGKEIGLYFEGLPQGVVNYQLNAVIEPDGRFQITVPPGPGVLLVQASPGIPPGAEFGFAVKAWPESSDVHRLFPYLRIGSRDPNDGAPGPDPQHLAGFVGPINLSRFHTYLIINPTLNADRQEIVLHVNPGVIRTLRLRTTQGQPVANATVTGLSSNASIRVSVEGAEADLIGLDPSSPRSITAMSADEKLSGTLEIRGDSNASVDLILRPRP